MPFVPPKDQHCNGNDPTTSTTAGPCVKSMPALERSNYGGTARRPGRPGDADDPPVSRSDLGKGHGQLAVHQEARINWRVLLISSMVILVFSITTILMPDAARSAMKRTTELDCDEPGLVLRADDDPGRRLRAVGRVIQGKRTRIGPDHSRPQYKLVTWVAMLFAAGVGIDMLFYSVTGPVVQYLHPLRR